jgi:hypothetical protein
MKELIDEKTFVTGLTAAAGLLFIVGAALFLGWRKRRPARSFAGLVMLIGGPALWLFWLAYCAVVKHFGLDSVKGLWVNIVIFIVVGALIGIFLGFLQRRKTEN